MKRRYRFLILLAMYIVLAGLLGLFGPSYVGALLGASITTGVLYIKKVQDFVLLSPLTAGVVMVISLALMTLFVRDNVISFWSLSSLASQLAVFCVTYLLFQGRLERSL